MSVNEDKTFQNDHSVDRKKKRRFLSPEKKFQIFLESQTGKTPVGEILRREGIYSTDLARIRKQLGGILYDQGKNKCLMRKLAPMG